MEQLVMTPMQREAVMTVYQDVSKCWLLIRVERILQPDTLEAYIKPDSRYQKSVKTLDKSALRHTQKLRRTVELADARLPGYRMAFGWTAQPLTKHSEQSTPLYKWGRDSIRIVHTILLRYDASKQSDDDIIKFLSDLNRPEKVAKMSTINSALTIGASR